jgi:hypothetical protein
MSIHGAGMPSQTLPAWAAMVEEEAGGEANDRALDVSSGARRS